MSAACEAQIEANSAVELADCCIAAASVEAEAVATEAVVGRAGRAKAGGTRTVVEVDLHSGSN
jgi:hypothetical protein